MEIFEKYYPTLLKEVIEIELKYIAQTSDTGQILKSILKDELHISSRLLIKLKTSDAIFVNGEPKFVNYIIKENDIVTVLIDFEEVDYIEPEEMNLDILYEDEYILVVNKPAGIVVHPSS